MTFSFENTKNKLGLRIWADRMSFYHLHELLSDCWYCEEEMSSAEACSYMGIISYFAYEVRHTFMGNRLVLRNGKAVKAWDDEMFERFEKEQDTFRLGMELSWPHVFFILSAWWECFRRRECPTVLLPVMREFEEGVDRLLQARNKHDYSCIAPYMHGALYSGNPYMMHAMEYATHTYLMFRSTGRSTLPILADSMACGVYGTFKYYQLFDLLKKSARRCKCAIDELTIPADDDLFEDLVL